MVMRLDAKVNGFNQDRFALEWVPFAVRRAFLMDLTEEQNAIVTLGYTHCVITAVAGSGKTTTLAWRIRHLLEQGHDPARMLILMFNRHARDDFTRKLRQVTRDTGLTLPEIRTYHAMGFRLYKRFIREGYLPPFRDDILTDQEIHYQVWLLLRQLVPEDLQDEARRNKKEYVETASHFIDLVKSTLTPAENVFEQQDYGDKHRYLIDLFHGFEQWRKREQRISFADMLYEPVMAIHQNPPLQRLVGDKMDLILVDEYQDTNEIQHLLLRYVAGERARVSVVGDPDQTIYEFRGAKPEFMLRRFAQEFDDPTELTLSYSFRYGHRVALLANHLISHNQGRKDVLCHAHDTTPPTAIHRHVHTDDAEVVLRLAREHQAQGRQLDDIAVVFRVWSQSVAIELRLLSQAVPYRIDSNRGALFTREMEAILALLGLLSGRLAEANQEQRRQALRTLMRFPHVGLKEPELNAIADFLAQFEQNWGERLLDLDSSHWKPLPARKVRKLGRALTELTGFEGKASAAISQYAEATELFDGIRSIALTHETADERIGTITGFQDYLAGLDVGVEPALEHLERLKALAAEPTQGGLYLATMHRTKGLEWPVVIIPGLQERYMPYTLRQVDDLPAFLESERRLLYVAMTRCRQALHLITRPEQGPIQPSRFMDELGFPLCQSLGEALTRETPETLKLEQPVTAIAQRYARHYGCQLKGTTPPPASQEGRTLWHQRRLNHAVFGLGEVLGDDERSFEVKFTDGRVMNFSKKSAHLYFTPER